MLNYFQPLRRKVGLVTLLLACALVAGWMRSFETIDSVYYPEPGTGGGSSILESENGFFLWYSTEPWWGTERQFPALFSRSIDTSSKIMTSNEVKWSTRFFGFASGEIEPPALLRGKLNRRLWVIPYWFIILPMTLLSGYLLLSKPRVRQPKPGSEA